MVSPDGPWPNVGLLVDAILGTGAKGPLRDAAAALVDRINDLTLPVAAIDGPTGVDLETGASHGSAVRAAVSITFGGLRPRPSPRSGRGRRCGSGGHRASGSRSRLAQHGDRRRLGAAHSPGSNRAPTRAPAAMSW